MGLVLVVDNDKDARDTFVDLVNDEFPELEVLTARNGVEALQKLEGRKPDLILSDYRMDEMDGVELLRRIRDEGDAKPPRVLWTIHDREVPVRLAKRDGVADHVVNKFKLAPLRALLQQTP